MASIHSITIDYVTLTAKLDTPEDEAIQNAYDAVSGAEFTSGLEEKASRKLGYRGTAKGTMFLGSRSDGRMLVASGTLAHYVMEAMRYNGQEAHCTRIDAQVTWEYDNDCDGLARILRDEVVDWRSTQSIAQPPRLTLIDGTGNGDTLQIGRRSSEVYCRIYDKTREQSTSGPPWLWRYEVELKKRRAQEGLQEGMRSHTLEDAARGMVEAFYRKAGVRLPWESTSAFVPQALPRPKADAEKQLLWLEDSVRPTVRKLIKAGYMQEVIDALGISW